MIEDFKQKFKNERYCRELIETAWKKGNIPNWGLISHYGNLSESFMREYWDHLDWGFIAEFQKLSEDFIREMKDKNDWLSISQCQRMSNKFMEEFKDDIRWDARKHFFGVDKRLYLKYKEYFDDE